MKKDVLKSTVMIRHTRRMLALTKRVEKAGEMFAESVADVGDELIATKQDLDNTPDKTAWTRWLKNHVHYTRRTAANYMRIARMRKILGNRFPKFLNIKISCLYFISSLPDHLLKSLTPETLLTDPRTGNQKPLKDMSERELDRAVDALQGRKHGERTPKSMAQRLRAIKEELKDISTQSEKLPADEWEKFRQETAKILEIETQTQATNGRIEGQTKEEFAQETLRKIEEFTAASGQIKTRTGKLRPVSKEKILSADEKLRVAHLKWPAWAKHAKKLKP